MYNIIQPKKMYHITKPIKEFLLNNLYLIENVYEYLIDARDPQNYNCLIDHLNNPINFDKNELSQISPYIIYLYIKQPTINKLTLNKCINLLFFPYGNRKIYSKEEQYIITRILNFDNKLLTYKRTIQIYLNSCKNGELGILQKIFHYIYSHIRENKHFRYELYIMKLLGLSVTNYKHIIEWLNTQCVNPLCHNIFTDFNILNNILSKLSCVLTKEDMVFVYENNINQKHNIKDNTNKCPTNKCPTNKCPTNKCPTNKCPTYIYPNINNIREIINNQHYIFNYNALFNILCDIHSSLNTVNIADRYIKNNNIIIIYNKIQNLILDTQYKKIKDIYNIYEEENNSDNFDIINKWLLLGYFINSTKEVKEVKEAEEEAVKIINWCIKRRNKYNSVVYNISPIYIYNQMQYHKQLFENKNNEGEEEEEDIKEDIDLTDIKWNCQHCTYENTNIEISNCFLCGLAN